MDNDEVIAKMWAAYQAGAMPYILPKENFDRWLSVRFPELLEAPKPPRELYWHEYGCKADVHTPNRTGNCTCDGREPDQSIKK